MMRRKYLNHSLILGLLVACSLGAATCTSNRQKDTRQIPCDSQATNATDSLLQVLASDCGTKTRFGHQDDTLYGHQWWNQEGRSDVLETTGHYPAVFGWELGGIEHGDSCSLDSVSFDDIRRQIILADLRGGINTISWHLDNPLNGHSSWDKTNNTVQAILNDSTVQTKFRTWLGRLATFFTSLKRDDGTLVPILFRPFHEHSGNWFWWGSPYCTPQEYKSLWKLTQKILKSAHVHNLLYIYSPDNVPDNRTYFERYPGDDLVDVLGLDDYHRGGADGVADYTERTTKRLKMMAKEAYQRQKIYVFSETGSESLPMTNWYTQVLTPILRETYPAYVLVWRNAYNIPTHFFAPYKGNASEKDFKKFAEQKNIIMGK